jgi:hypothetical protein
VELDTGLRLLLLYAHLLLCVFALYSVLSGDWRLLRARMSAPRLLRTHRRVSLALAGLWATGLAIVLIDTQGQWSSLQSNGKLLAKLACVLLLTANAGVLRWWSFPRLTSDRPLGRLESWALMSSGAVSTACWLMAGFYGVARPLKTWPFEHNLALLGLVLLVAVPSAMALSGRLRQGRRLRLRDGQLRVKLLSDTTQPVELSSDLDAQGQHRGWVSR